MKNELTKVVITFLVLATFTLPTNAQKKLGNQSKDMLIKNEVETAISMLKAIFGKYEAEVMTLEAAKKLGADLLRELRYGKDGYFWADTEEGVNVVLYGRKDVEGINRFDAVDEHGNYFIKNLISKAQAGGGYIEYWFTKKGEKKAEAKRSYVELFKPFGWVVGTGYYR